MATPILLPECETYEEEDKKQAHISAKEIPSMKRTRKTSKYSSEELIAYAQQYYAKNHHSPTVRAVPWSAIAIRQFGNWTQFLLDSDLPVEYLERKSKYTKDYFIQEIQTYYAQHQEIPTSNQYEWSGTAIQRFGSWNTLIRSAGYTPRKPGGAYHLL